MLVQSCCNYQIQGRQDYYSLKGGRWQFRCCIETLAIFSENNPLDLNTQEYSLDFVETEIAATGSGIVVTDRQTNRRTN